MEEKLEASDHVIGGVNAPVVAAERGRALGRFTVQVRDADGNLIRDETFPNTVVTQGKNNILDEALAGSAYTAAWYMGLISSASFSAIAATDTAAQINGTNGWKEAGNAHDPTYTGARLTCVFSAASAGSKAISPALVFTILANGSSALIEGVFLASTSTVDGTTGVLLSAGLFTGGTIAVQAGYTVTVSWSLSI